MIKNLLFLLVLCFSCTKESPVGTEKPIILVTLPPYAFVVERIAGNTVDVSTLIPPGMNIHVFEPKPRQVHTSGKATIWFQISEPFEKKVTRVFKEKNPQMQIVNLQKSLPLLSAHSSVELGEACQHDHGDFDTHTWTSPKLFLEQAKIIADTLIAAYPQHTTLYQTNFNHLALDLQNLDREISQLLAPYKGDAILISHPALGYFCKDYDLIQLSVECEGKEPRPRDVENILAQAEKFKVRAIFLQQGFNNRGASLIAKKLQIPPHRIDPFAKDYLKNMRQIAEYIGK